MPQFDSRVLLAKKETPGVMTFRFDVPVKGFEFRPGQYITLSIGDGLSKPLSISCSPTKKGFIEVSKKITDSDFSKKIAAIKKGDKVKISGPFGRFVLEEDKKNIAMLSGGIGITPLRSMLQFAADKNLSNKITLFYSNQTPEETVFYEELKLLEKKNPGIKIIFTITRPEETKQKWGGKTGRIDEKMIKENTPDFENAVFYICGPPTMVDALKELLKKMNVPDQKIRMEMFSGYK